MNIVIGTKVRQTQAPASKDIPDAQKYLGRESVVVHQFIDEKNVEHSLTEDGIWCPTSLLSPI